MYEYPARIKLTSKMAGNGDVYSKIFNGRCMVGINRKNRGTINKRAEEYLKAVSNSLGEPAEVMCVQKPGRAGLPQLEVVSRVAAIPIVESGIGVAERIYFRIKDSNPLIRWYLTVGERSLSTGVQMALPAVQLLETPINQLDKFLCKSLDVVEKRVPSIYLPPQMMYSETREYVLRRADSVKQLGTAVLDSRMTAVTATALERALTTADKYVDKYLPPDYQDAADVTSAEGEGGEVGGTCEESGRACAAQAVQRGARLRRKLQRRLTRQALAEAKAIKEQIHVLVYVAELIATDPALAWKKAKQLYESLSCPEPENQARPATLEELVVLLARETARKVVHLVNYTHTDLSNNMRQGMSLISKHLSSAANAILKALPVDSAISEVRNWRSKVQALLHQLQETSKTYLVLKHNGADAASREANAPSPRGCIAYAVAGCRRMDIKHLEEKGLTVEDVDKKWRHYLVIWLMMIAIILWICTYITVLSILTFVDFGISTRTILKEAFFCSNGTRT